MIYLGSGWIIALELDIMLRTDSVKAVGIVYDTVTPSLLCVTFVMIVKSRSRIVANFSGSGSQQIFHHSLFNSGIGLQFVRSIVPSGFLGQSRKSAAACEGAE